MSKSYVLDQESVRQLLQLAQKIKNLKVKGGHGVLVSVTNSASTLSISIEGTGGGSSSSPSRSEATFSLVRQYTIPIAVADNVTGGDFLLVGSPP